ncbi:MAG: flagellar hook-associated protein FlgK [Desulfobacterales bacterium]|nr:flagellar hook-associated protein FlgK [Desulfobacterales bacterium]
MSGLGLVLSIAKDALAAQQYGISVTGHNIANVNTPGYSRQRAVHEAKEPAPYGGVLLGRGVDTAEVVRVSDQYIENQLMEQKSNMLSSREMENYMQVLEGLFSENSEISMSTMLSDFWNSWHDIANNPSGASERIALYEHSILLSEQFNTLNADLTQLETDLTGAMGAGLNRINQITNEIAQVNNQIVGTEISNIANDLRDKRNTLISELAEYLDVKTFEQSSGSLTVVTARGCILVDANNSYDLELNGTAVEWQSSGGATVDITNYMTRGKIGGWLNMRDEIVEKYKKDLSEIASEFIWTVNKQHSQGVGLQFFSNDVTGTYKTGSSGLLSTLTYGQDIDYTKDFKMWIKDSSVTPATFSAATVDMEISSASISNWVGDNSAATSYSYTFTVTTGGTVGGAVNPVITWTKVDTAGNPVGGSNTITIDSGAVQYDVEGTMKFNVGEGTLVAGNTFTINTNTDGAPKPLDIDLSASDPANSILDTYKFTVTSGGEVGTGTLEIKWSNSTTSGTFTLDGASTTAEVDGMTIDFTAGGYLFDNDVFTITTDASGEPTANLPSEWHWTLESFAGEFNTQATGVSATVTSDNALEFSPDSSNYSFAFSDDEAQDSGLMAAFGINTFFQGSAAGSIGVNTVLNNKDYIAAAQIDADTGDLAPGNNTNALAIAGLQYTSTEIKQWTCDRLNGNTQGTVNATIEDYYHAMVGSMGIKSASISRGRAFNEIMVNKLGEVRDSISAVSLDEEMTNLIKFQHAYAAAAKLISVSDEMLNTLLSVK